MIKKIFNSKNVNNISLLLLVFCVLFHLCTAIVFGKSFISSLFFYISYIIVGIWYCFTAINQILNFKHHNYTKKTMVSFIISLTIIIFAVINSLISYFLSNVSLTFDSIKKIASLIGAILLTHCLLSNQINKRSCKIISIAVLVFSCLLVLIFFLKFNDIFRGINHTQLDFFLSNPNEAALMLLSLICILVYSAYASHFIILKIVYCFFSIILTIFLYLTSARGPLIALVLGFIVYLIKIRKIETKLSFLSCLNISFLPFVIVTIYIPLIALYNLNKPEGHLIVEGGKFIDTRFEIWTSGFKQLFSSTPNSIIFGNYFNVGSNPGVFHFHNAMFDSLIAYGLIVFLLIGFYYAFVIKCTSFDLKTKSQRVALTFLIISIFTEITESAVLSSGSGLYILSLIPIIFVKNPRSYDLINENNCSKKINVFIVNSVFDYGSTGKIVSSLQKELNNNDICAISCYGRRNCKKQSGLAIKICSEFESKLSHILCSIFKDPYSFNFFSTLRLEYLIKKYNPQIIHLHSFNDYYINIYRLCNFLKRRNTKMVLTLHSENAYIGNCGGLAYNCNEWSKNPGCVSCKIISGNSSKKVWAKIKNCFSNFNNLKITAVSPWLAYRAKSSPIFKNKEIHIVENGVDEIFKPYNQNYSLSETPNVFYVSANLDNPNKGFSYFLKLATLMGQTNPEIKFTVVSLKDIKMRLPTNVTLLKPIFDKRKLAEVYSNSDATLITSKIETFSMPVAESLCCGTPVCGFCAGGPETIAINSFSNFVEFGNIQALKNAVLETIKYKSKSNEISKIALEKFSVASMSRKYIKIYNLSNKQNNLFFELII